MTPNWDVEPALQEVVEAIQKGSPLDVSKDVQDGYKTRYRPDFLTQYKAKAEWDKDKIQVLPRARLVGALAATMTIAKSVLTLNRPPQEVDAKSAYLAGFLIAHGLYCPAGKLLGHYCQSYPRKGLDLADDRSALLALAQAILSLIAPLELESDRARRGSHKAAKSKSGSKKA